VEAERFVQCSKRVFGISQQRVTARATSMQIITRLAKRVNVQGLVLDDENTIVEHKTAGSRAQVGEQEGRRQPERSARNRWLRRRRDLRF